MKFKSIISNTLIDRDNMKMTKEELEEMAKVINGESVIRLGVEHDITFSPVGKTLEAHVEPIENWDDPESPKPKVNRLHFFHQSRNLLQAGKLVLEFCG